MHSGLFAPIAARLAERFRVLLVDLPGHGRSAPLAPYTLEALAAAVAEAVRRAGGEPPLTVLGWSLGGAVALQWAASEPGPVARLVLVATTPCFVARTDWPRAMSAATLRKFGDELSVSYRLTLQRFVALQAAGGDEPREALAALRSQLFVRGEPSPATLREALACLEAIDLRSRVAAIAQPATVIAGERDVLVPPAASAWLARTLPRASFHLLRRSAHAPFLSHPQAFLAALDDEH